MLNIVGHKKIWFTISGTLIVLAILAIVFYGFKQSAEFKGGTLLEFSAIADHPSSSDIQNIFTNNLNIKDAQVTLDNSTQTFIIRFDSVDEATHQKIDNQIKSAYLRRNKTITIDNFNEPSFIEAGIIAFREAFLICKMRNALTHF